MLHWRRRHARWVLLAPLLALETPVWQPCARLRAREINECSGIVSSRRYPGIFWVHNDSGDGPRLFAIDGDGAVVREVHVQGARNVDWEDLAADDTGHLYIGDFGNNDNERRDLVVYVVDEPDPRGPGAAVLVVPVLRSRPFRFPEQRDFPDPDVMNYDCEALFWDAGNLYVLTKHRSDTRTVLYRLPRPGSVDAVPLGSFEIGSPVTAAALSRDGQTLAVLSYQYIHLFERPASGENFLAGASQRILIEGRQCEGIEFDGERLLFTNEQREIYCLSLTTLRALGSYLPAPPETRLLRLALGEDGTAAGWERALPLTLHPEPPEVAAGRPPEVRLAWCPTGLLLHASWPLDARTEVSAGSLLQIMVGPRGVAEPALQSGQRVWEVTWAGDRLQLCSLLPEAGEPLPGVTQERTATELRLAARLPGVLAAGETLLVNVVLRDAAQKERSWSWAGGPSTQPEQNPLLWGQVELDP